MIVSLIVTSYFVIGLKVDKQTYEYEPFSFSLPFPSFRDGTNEAYWKEVLEKIYTDFNIPKDAELYLATQEEYLLGLEIFSKSSRISDILASDSLPVVYIGETRGSVKGVISPFIISPTDFYRWFYLAQNINQVENYFYNRRAYGVRKPVSSWERGFEESLFREKLTFLFENNEKEFFDNTKDLVLSGEGVMYAGEDTRLILSFLDSATSGFWRIYLDRDSVVLNLENIKLLHPEVFKKVSEKFVLSDLAGCLVVPSATQVELSYANGEKLQTKLQEDSISVIPFERTSKVSVKVFFDKKETFVEVTGGQLGLVIDNRPRPLLKDKTSKQRINSIDRWLKEISSKVDFSKDGVTKEKDTKAEEEALEMDISTKVLSKGTTHMELQVAHKLLVEGKTAGDDKVIPNTSTSSKPVSKPIKKSTKKKHTKKDVKEKSSSGTTNTKNTIDLVSEKQKSLEDAVIAELYNDEKTDKKKDEGDTKKHVPINRDTKIL